MSEEKSAEQWLDEEFAQIAKERANFTCVAEEMKTMVFPDEIMEIIGSDHHKSRDGILTISYDHYGESWYVNHPGYVRNDIYGRGASLYDAWCDFRTQILKENLALRKRGAIDALEEKINKQLPEDKSVEITFDGRYYSATYYQVTDKGVNQLRSMQFSQDLPSEEEIMTQVREQEEKEE